jgi:phenylacetic acid degradation protein paaN
VVDLLARGTEALRTRESFSGYEGRRPAGPDAAEADRFLAGLLGKPFEMAGHPGTWAEQPDEVSPYTRTALGISYPRAEVDELVAASTTAQPAWAATPYAERTALCVALLERLFDANELLALAAMHTTGQGRGMSRSGSGTNALDRGLEAVCAAHLALSRVPQSATWSREFGTTVTLTKTFRAVPLGPAVVVACASFPSWNVYPALFASLATGNPVIVKPHPSSVLQMALAVRTLRDGLGAAGHDPDLVLLATDTVAEPVATTLLTHDGVRIVDFTGSAVFGSWVEESVRRKAVYTETSGVNSVVVESLGADADAALQSLASSFSLFSGQMCVAAQNVFVPAAGVPTPDGVLSVEEVGARLAAAVAGIAGHPRRAAAVWGTIQSDRTVDALAALERTVAGRGEVLLGPAPYAHPEFPDARTSGPLVARLSLEDHDLYGHEQFGPVLFLIPVPDAAAGLAQAAADARTGGAIAAYVLSQDEEFVAAAEDAFATAGAALSVNVVGPMPMGFSAAFGDYHVTGLNPAGTATLTDESFIAGRFRVVQSRRPAAPTLQESA